MLTWVGVSWRVAPSARRAGLRALQVPGAVAIHTCARDAWLVEGEGPVLEGFAVDRREGPEAVARFFAVACGLDSPVQGEADVGRQVRAALAASDHAAAPVLDHVLGRLLRRGRREGWIRAGQGVAALAVRELGDAAPVGIVGAGALGVQLWRRLGPRGRLYNRSPRDGARPLDALEPAHSWVVATAAPAPWFQPPEPYARLIDLGHPAQTFDDPRRIGLDTLLASGEARLDPEALTRAERAVGLATDEALNRLARRPAARGAA